MESGNSKFLYTVKPHAFRKSGDGISIQFETKTLDTVVGIKISGKEVKPDDNNPYFGVEITHIRFGEENVAFDMAKYRKDVERQCDVTSEFEVLAFSAMTQEIEPLILEKSDRNK